ncbi:MAG: DUF2612 domain-containing protein [Gammaproteobacteria bacterium]|nr:DUF2612 domain-containing protein [Gammaproteobacteria bacterium]
MPRTDLPALLLGQWQNSPKLVAVARDIIQWARDNILDGHDDMAANLNLATAGGLWLDMLGARVGLPRPLTTDPAQDTRFGFDSAGQGWDQVPFRGVAANDAVFPLPDAVYRRMLAARAVLMFGQGTFGDLLAAVRAVDSAARVVDNRDMTVSVVTSQLDTLLLADEVGALPRSAGVRLVITETMPNRLVWGGNRLVWGGDPLVW